MSTQPNILILLTDQQRVDTIASAGASWMHTPNLDRLVREGCTFTNAYSPTPICVPARHGMLTSARCRDHGFYTNAGEYADDGLPTYPLVLSDHGYHTAAVGKMHYKPFRRHHGQAEMHLMEEIPRHVNDDAYTQWLAENGYGHVRCIHGVRPLLYREPQRSQVPAEFHGTNFVAERAIEVMRRNADRPWALTCGFIQPHPPWSIPEEFEGMYSDADLPEPAPPVRHAPISQESAYYGDEEPQRTRRMQEAYYTCVSMVDQAVGKILNHLDETGQIDSTIIVFTSDHGEMLGDHGMSAKGVAYEGASHIPFVIRYPQRFAPGSTDDRFCDLLDVFPTLLDLTDIDLHDKASRRKYQLAGESLLAGPGGKRNRDTQFVEYGRDAVRWIMLRDKRYKYVFHYNGNVEWFFDLQDDPQELDNLVGTDRLPEENFRRLQRQCWQTERRDGPEGYAQPNGHYTRFEPWRARVGTRYDSCAIFQNPKIGDEPRNERAARLAEEIRHALSGSDDPDYAANIPAPAEWKANWAEHFRKYGGSEEDIADLLGKPRGETGEYRPAETTARTAR